MAREKKHVHKVQMAKGKELSNIMKGISVFIGYFYSYGKNKRQIIK